MTWTDPLPLRLHPSKGRDEPVPPGCTPLPIAPHPGAFGVQRRFERHTGVDLYAPVGTPVTAVEDGTVVGIEWFTGPNSDPPSPWWNPTMAVLVAGRSGVVLYGEIEVDHAVEVGCDVRAGDTVGRVVRVLRHDKGYPTSMLHLELHQAGTTASSHPWTDVRPPTLLDPTPYLWDVAAPFTSVLSSDGAAVQRIHDLVRMGRITPSDGAWLLQLREDLRRARRPWWRKLLEALLGP